MKSTKNTKVTLSHEPAQSSFWAIFLKQFLPSFLALSLVPTIGIAAASTAPAPAPTPPQPSPSATPAPGPSVAVDPQVSSLLSELQSLNPKPIETLSPQEARIQPNASDAIRSLLAKQNKVPSELGVTDVRDITVGGAAGLLPARVYRPDAIARTKAPAIVYFHGGGWVLADLDTYDASARALSAQSSAVVISVDYRKAPEAKFPAAHDDAFAAYKWILDNAASLNIDSIRVAIAGESAGGNLAINTSIRARDSGVKLPIFEIAIYPVAGADLNTPSYQKNANAKPLNKAMMQWFFQQYLASPEQIQDPRINLVSADLHGLPPTMIITADLDPLQSEGQLLAQRLKTAGVNVTERDFTGVPHEFFGWSDVLKPAQAAQSFTAGALRSRF